MALLSKVTTTVHLECDNTFCTKEADIEADQISESPWIVYRCTNSERTFLYERVEDTRTKMPRISSTRLVAEDKKCFCSTACAEQILSLELQKFLHKPIVPSGTRRRL